MRLILLNTVLVSSTSSGNVCWTLYSPSSVAGAALSAAAAAGAATSVSSTASLEQPKAISAQARTPANVDAILRRVTKSPRGADSNRFGVMGPIVSGGAQTAKVLCSPSWRVSPSKTRTPASTRCRRVSHRATRFCSTLRGSLDRQRPLGMPGLAGAIILRLMDTGAPVPWSGS